MSFRRKIHVLPCIAFVTLTAFACLAADWKIAEPGWQYQFPRDHRIHREFKTEWWYFTGNVFDAGGRRFGYELTFFRQGIRRDPSARNESRFIVGDLKFAHFAVTDVAKRRFRFEQKTSRGAFGEAGFEREGDRLAWLDDWSLEMESNGSFKIKAAAGSDAIEFQLRGTKLPAVHGQDGISVKASGSGHASHYYSMTRLETTGALVVEGKSYRVHGESWFDHEWATSQLAENQEGWDWFCVQWEDQSELMIYRMRLKSGGSDSSSSGSRIAPSGDVMHLQNSDFQMSPIGFWKSRTTSARYPIAWHVAIPGEGTEFTIRAVVDDQELTLGPITYWEGAIDAIGVREGKEIRGRGYLELTGYGGSVGALSR